MKSLIKFSRCWLLSLVVLISTLRLTGQCDENLLINQGFEIVGPPCGTVPPGGLINGSFNQGCMTGWEAAWGTPSVCSNNPGEGDYYACLGANNEGFFQTLDLSPDSTYCLSFYFRGLNGGSGNLDVYLASGLVNQPMGNSGNPPITVLPSWQLLGSFPVNSNQWEQIIIPGFMQLDPANNQLLFLDVPTGGLDVGIDDVKLSNPQNIDPAIEVDITCTEQSGNTFTFEGSINPFPPGFEEAQWFWSFGDGQTGTGEVVTHTYATYGQYEVCLSIFLICGCAYNACITFSYDPCTCACAEDVDPPQFVSFNPGPILVNCLEDIPQAQAPDISDCDPAAFLTLEETETGPPCNRTISYRWIASDLCGNTSEMTQTIIFEDISPPQFDILPASLVWPCPDYLPEFLLWISDFGGASVTDECGVVNLSVDYEPGFSGDCGEVPVDFIATDECGNQSSMQAVFTYTDTDAPELLQFPENLVFPCSGVMINELDQWLEANAGASVTEACGNVTWSNDFIGVFNDDTVEVIFIAEDQCFNSLSFSALIIQTDAVETTLDTMYTCAIQSAGIDTVLQVSQSCSLFVITQSIFIPADLTADTILVCDPLLAATDTTYFTNRFGCDSLLILTSLLASSDTVKIETLTCDPLVAGADTTYFVNRFGCDSLIILTSLLASSDTVKVEALTCDPLVAGADTTYLINRFGCDSLFILTSVLASSDTTRIESFICDSSGASADTLIFTGANGCDSIVINTVVFFGGQLTVEDEVILCGPGVNFSDTILVQGVPCDSVLITNYIFVPLDTTLVATRVCNPSDTGTITIVLPGGNGCDSTILMNNLYFPPDSLTVIEYTCFGLDTMVEGLLLSDQFGCDSLFYTFYLINAAPDTQFVQQTSCDTSMTGIATVIIPGLICDTVRVIETTWIPSYTSRDTQRICEPPLIVADTFYFIAGGGCDSIVILEYTQDGPQMDVLARDETCLGSNDGVVEVLAVDGGVPPYLFSFNGGQFGSDTIWDSLAPGSYMLIIEDSEMCKDSVNALSIDAGVPFSINAGPDITVETGAFVTLQLASGVDWSTGNWKALDPVGCSTCPVTQLGPITQEQSVHVSVINQAGCMASDSFSLYLQKDIKYYVPNVFSPDFDGVNDNFFVTCSASIISTYDMVIFDRWGNQVFQAIGVSANDASAGWDGQFRGQRLDPGVFVFKIEVKSDGSDPQTISGNVTLIR